jgi:hypothetical protein
MSEDEMRAETDVLTKGIPFTPKERERETISTQQYHEIDTHNIT